MPSPVVHFEIIGEDPRGLRSYFWQPFRLGVRDGLAGGGRGVHPERYGFVDLLTTADGNDWLDDGNILRVAGAA